MSHGEGKKWYLQAKHYSDELVNEERKSMLAAAYEGPAEETPNRMGEMDKLWMTDPDAAKAAASAMVEQAKKIHYGQVVPLEEIEQIIDMDVGVVRLACSCRSVTCGVSDARYCYGLTSIWQSPSSPVRQYPDYAKDFEVLTNEEAKKSHQKLDQHGLVHTVWTWNTPFIAWICNCTVSECLGFKMRLRRSIPLFFKVEYVGNIDWESCNGCRDCIKNCSFGAIYHSPLVHKCYIDQFQCYGCGVCRAVCSRDAITLRDRNAIPMLAKDW